MWKELQYIGQMSRPDLTRLEEHKKTVDKRESYGPRVCEHESETGRGIQWE